MKKAVRIVAVLLGGLVLLSVALWIRRPESSGSGTQMQAVELSRFWNCRLDESLHPQTKANSLGELPRGRQTLLQVPYDLGGAILLSGRHARDLGGTYPKKTPEIVVGRPCLRLHVLIGTGWQEADGTPIAVMRCRFENGTTLEVPIKYGVHVRNWWADGKESDAAAQASVAWRGTNGDASAAGCTLRLYSWTWENPAPAERLAGLEVTSLETACAPFVVAVTAALAP